MNSDSENGYILPKFDELSIIKQNSPLWLQQWDDKCITFGPFAKTALNTSLLKIYFSILTYF